MNPFSTPERKPQAVHIQVFYKADVIAFIQSMQFDYIELPLGMTTSSDNSDTSTFVRFFCDALADVLVQYAPKESSPKRLLDKMSLLEIDTPTKIRIGRRAISSLVHSFPEADYAVYDCFWYASTAHVAHSNSRTYCIQRPYGKTFSS